MVNSTIVSRALMHRSSQSPFPERYGGAWMDPSPYWGAIGSGEFLGEEESFFFKYVATGKFPVLQWMGPHPYTRFWQVFWS